jgi:serine/threonine-protein kinase
MAPEQVAGESIDPRTDVYALGCVLYEMLTGTPPFEGSSGVVVMGKQLRDTPPPPRVRAPDRLIPHALEAAVIRAMSKDPARRFPTAESMRSALLETIANPERRRSRARRAATAALLVAGMVASAGASAYWTRTHPLAVEGVPPESAPTPAPVTVSAAASLPAPGLSPAPAIVLASSAPLVTSTPSASSAPLPPAPPRLVDLPLHRDTHTVAKSRAETDVRDRATRDALQRSARRASLF